jgi:hypothetical protein
VFSIRSVKETARNDEAGLLVLDPDPRSFESASTLFASIQERYADEFVEVYAPLEWATEAEKNRIRRIVRQPVLEEIEANCRTSEQGAQP